MFTYDDLKYTMFQIPAFLRKESDNEDAILEIAVSEENEIVKLKLDGKEYLINKSNFVRLGKICVDYKSAEKPLFWI